MNHEKSAKLSGFFGGLFDKLANCPKNSTSVGPKLRPHAGSKPNRLLNHEKSAKSADSSAVLFDKLTRIVQKTTLDRTEDSLLCHELDLESFCCWLWRAPSMTFGSWRFAVLGVAGLIALPTAGKADIIETFNGAGFSAGTAPYGTVTISQDGTNALDFKVVLNDTLDVHDNMAGFLFSIVGDPSLTLSNLKVTQDGTTFVLPTAITPNPTFSLGADTTSQDGATSGNHLFNYALQCGDCAPSSGAVDIQGFSFTVTAGSALFAQVGTSNGDITTNANGYYSSLTAYLDSDTGTTGQVSSNTFSNVSVPGPVVGAGLPGLIAACGGLIALARRRRSQLVA
jgi:hypothetical protein